MGKLIPVVLIMIVAPSVCAAQELAMFGGFQFGGGFTTQDGELNIPSAANFGGTLGFSVGPATQFQLFYSRQATQLDLEDEATGAATRLFDLTVEYIQVGMLYQYGVSKVKPFVGVMAGVTHLDPQDRADEWWLSGSFDVGAKTLINEYLGFRADARFSAAWGRTRDAVFCAPVVVGGCLVGLRSGIMVQTAITGGAFVAF